MMALAVIIVAFYGAVGLALMVWGFRSENGPVFLVGLAIWGSIAFGALRGGILP